MPSGLIFVLFLLFMFLAMGVYELYKLRRCAKKKPEDFSREFFLIVAKYGLADKVELHKFWEFGDLTLTLFRVIEKEIERDLPLPSPLVDDIRGLVKRYYGGGANFKVDRGRMRQEILKEIEAWENHCKLANACY